MSYNGIPPLSTTTVYRYPVQFESVDHLCGCTLANGTGFLSWVNGVEIHFATHSSSMDWVIDGSITASSGTITPAGTTELFSQSNWLGNDGIPYVLTTSRTGFRHYMQLFKGNAATPTGFSLLVTMQDLSATDGIWTTGGTRVCGIPYINGNTWVLPASVYNVSLDNIYTRAGIYRSTNAGASWSLVYEKGFHNGGRYADHVPGHIGYDPATGYLFFMSGTTGGGATAATSVWVRSTNGGASWTEIQNVGPGNYQTTYTGFGVMYGLEGGNTVRFNAPNTDMNDQTVIATHLPTSRYFRHVSLGRDGTLFLFSGNTVQATPGGWTVGYFGIA